MRTVLPWLMLACLPACAVTADAPSPPPELIAGAWIAGAQPDGNSVLFDAPDGLVLLDTGRHLAHGRRVADAIRARGGKPLRWIVNSHWHLDHIGGNAELRAAFPGATLLASDAVREAHGGFLARYRSQLVARQSTLSADDDQQTAIRRELSIIDDRAAQTPDMSVHATSERILAGAPFIVGLARHAVTGGDVWLYHPASRTLATGDLVTLPVPLFDTACPERWQAELDGLARLPFQRVLPGHGPALDRAGFDRYRRAFRQLLQCAAGPAADDRCIDGWLRDADDLVPPAQQGLARAYLAYYLEQHLRAPADKARANCPA